MQVSPCRTALCLARPVARATRSARSLGARPTSRLTTCTRPHRRTQARSSEIGQARCGYGEYTRSCAYPQSSRGSSTKSGTRARKNGKTRRTLITAVSFRALALAAFYHRRWPDFKGLFWSTVAVVVRLRSCLKSYDFSYVVRRRPPFSWQRIRSSTPRRAGDQKERLTSRFTGKETRSCHVAGSFAPQGQSSASPGQRPGEPRWQISIQPWKGVPVETSMSRRHSSHRIGSKLQPSARIAPWPRPPYQGFHDLWGKRPQGVALGWCWNAPLGLAGGGASIESEPCRSRTPVRDKKRRPRPIPPVGRNPCLTRFRCHARSATTYATDGAAVSRR